MSTDKPEMPQPMTVEKTEPHHDGWTAQEIYDDFKAAIATGGPVLIAAAMRTPSHFHTKDPILEKSPLMRLAIAAANMGITNLVFDPEEDFVAALGNYQSEESSFCQAIEEKGVPAFFLHWCSLNAAFFDASLQREKTHRNTTAPSPENRNIKNPTIQGGIFDRAFFEPQNEKHQANIRLVLDHLRRESQNYEAAAQRVEAALSSLAS